MLTKEQIKKLPKGDYPNWMLVKMFPRQQGAGRSARFQKVTEKGSDTLVTRLINQFTGKAIFKRQKKS